jgi:predicted ATP-grasp superfamily ATP-dependent carboligase
LTPAVVLGSGVTALAVVRALRRHGIATHVMGPPGDIASRSRGALPTRLAHDVGANRIASLEAISWPDHGVLIPCDDDWLLAVAQFVDERRGGSFSSITPPVAAVEQMLDKGAFADVLDEIGIPRPRTWAVRTADDLAEIEDGELAAFFLKPRDSKRFTEDFGVKALPIRDRRHAEQQLALAVARGHEMIAQEFVASDAGGNVCLDGFVDRHGRFAAIIARRRLRMYPVPFGNTTDTVTVPLSDVSEAVSSLQRLFDRIGHRGLFEAEFMLDRSSGKHKIIEVNARPWWQIQLVGDAGVDVVHMAYLDALGVDVAPQTWYAIGKRWVHTIPDLRSRWHARDGSGVRPHAAQRWWRATHAVFQTTDPVPGLVQLRRTARDGLRRLARHEARDGELARRWYDIQTD